MAIAARLWSKAVIVTLQVVRPVYTYYHPLYAVRFHIVKASTTLVGFAYWIGVA